MTRLLLLLTVLLAPLLTDAQDLPIRWGRISDAEIALDSIAGDPDANAVVLGDVGIAEVRLAGGRERFEYEVRRHRRIKVLNEAGYGLGEVSLRFGDGSEIRGIKGQTFVPEPNGTMRRVELSSRSILEEDVSDRVREVRFSMPALAPGAIFEIEYTYRSESLFAPPTWYFQSSEPTVVSEYRLEVPEYFGYVFYTRGSRVRADASERTRRSEWEGTRYRWTATQVPALREEPYTTTEEDYAHKLVLQLSQVAYPGRGVENVLSTWGKVAEELEGHDEFGRRLRRNRQVEALAAGVTGTDEERARALYDLVRTDFVWNGDGGTFADRDLDAVVEARSGSAGELSLLLLALLREADVPATPVLLSTRSNGQPVQQYPLVTQFDRLVVLAEPEGGDLQLLDPTSRHRRYGMLDPDALNDSGWLADSARPEWFTFSAPTNTATVSALTATLGEDGRLEGSLLLRLDGYDALALRTRLAEEEAAAPAAAAEAAEEAAADAADASDDVEIEETVVIGLDDPYVPVTVTSQVTATAGEVVGDEIYLTPIIAMQLDKNPFERPARDFPVDFAYPFQRSYTASIELPEGYRVLDLPAPVRMTIPSGAVTYTRVMGEERGQLQVRAVLNVSQAEVAPEEYPSLRLLYDEIVAAEAEAVVLVRESDAPADAPAEAGLDGRAPTEGDAPVGDASAGDQPPAP